MAVETLNLGEKSHVKGVPVQNADRVVWIAASHNAVAGIDDALEMAGRDVPCDPRYCEIPRRLADIDWSHIVSYAEAPTRRVPRTNPDTASTTWRCCSGESSL